MGNRATRAVDVAVLALAWGGWLLGALVPRRRIVVHRAHLIVFAASHFVVVAAFLILLIDRIAR